MPGETLQFVDFLLAMHLEALEQERGFAPGTIQAGDVHADFDFVGRDLLDWHTTTLQGYSIEIK
jgi:hypothetical protein